MEYLTIGVLIALGTYFGNVIVDVLPKRKMVEKAPIVHYCVVQEELKNELERSKPDSCPTDNSGDGSRSLHLP